MDNETLAKKEQTRALPWIVAATAIAAALAAAASGACASAPLPPIEVPEMEPELTLPLEDDSLRFAVIGDAGTGGRLQYEIATMMAGYHPSFPFEFVLLLGDNLYGGEDPGDYRRKFEIPYAPLLEEGVDFYASLGNHDDRTQRMYEDFNMDGELYYSFAPDGHDVRFFSIHSDYLDPEQVEWLEQELAESDEGWKICFFHHPIYSSGGRHGADLELREVLEPLFIEHGVDVVFTGHDHVYERLHPQNGIYYFVSGAGGKLRRGDVAVSGQTAAKYDDDGSFMLLEMVDSTLYFQVISRQGQTVDSGYIEDPTPKTDR